MRHAALLLPLVVATTACLHTETLVRTDEKVINSTPSTVSLAPKFEVTATVVGDELAITATKVQPCRDEVVESVATVESVKVGPPNGHWVLLGAGALVLAGGIVSAAVGSPMQASVAVGSLPSPEQERQRDTGGVLVPVGVVAAGVGGALVVWDLANLFSSGTKERASPPVTRTVQKEQRECRRRAASDYPLDLRSEGRTTQLRTGASGKIQVSLVQAAFKDWPLRRPFLTVSGVPVELPAQLAAKVAIAGRRSKDLAWWLSTFPDADAALRGEVDAVRLVVVEEEKVEAERSASEAKVAAEKRVVELTKEARESFRAGERGGHSGDYADASNKAAECLELAPDNKSCRDIGARADKVLEGLRQRAEKKLLAERAKQQKLDELAEAKRAAATLGMSPDDVARSFVTADFDVRVVNRLLVPAGQEFAGHDRTMFSLRQSRFPEFECTLQVTSTEDLAEEVAILCRYNLDPATGLLSVATFGNATAAVTGRGSPAVKWIGGAVNAGMPELAAAVKRAPDQGRALATEVKKSGTFENIRVELRLNPAMLLFKIWAKGAR